jgi:hypothetical protein
VFSPPAESKQEEPEEETKSSETENDGKGNEDYTIVLLEKTEKPVETIQQDETMTIHLDDSIRVVKNKIIKMLEKYRLSYKEIYLFSQNPVRSVNSEENRGTGESLDLNAIYTNVTQNGEQPLDNAKMTQVCQSLHLDEKVTLDPAKTTYSLEEFLAVLSGADINTVSVPIGPRFETSYQWLFSANPYHISVVLPDIKKTPLFLL